MTSRQRMRIGTFCMLIAALGEGVAAQAAPLQGPCAHITAACQQAGFVLGGARGAHGLQVDCIAPIMQGTAPPRGASKPLPQVDPQLVAACKARNPSFGQLNALPLEAGVPSSLASPPPPVATIQTTPPPSTSIPKKPPN